MVLEPTYIIICTALSKIVFTNSELGLSMYIDSMNDSSDAQSVKTGARNTPVKKSPVVQTRTAQPQRSKPVEQAHTLRQDTENNIATNPYFSVQDLIVGYDDTIVVNGMSLILEQGEIGCFLGYSGCGKTTALRATRAFLSADDHLFKPKAIFFATLK